MMIPGTEVALPNCMLNWNWHSLHFSGLLYLTPQNCAGYVCVRGFDRATRQPKRVCGTLHATNSEKKEGKESPAKKARTPPKASRNNEEASSANQDKN
jgi:hypothetical protein